MESEKQKKILIVDDDIDIQNLIKEFLLDAGYNVFVAGDGKTALETALRVHPDLVVLDVELPDMLGFDVCRQLKSEPTMSYVPVVMLTARTQESDELRGFEAGVNDYLTKPFKPARLLARIHTAMEQTIKTLEASPLTQLPGNAAIHREIELRLNKKEPFSVIYADLNNFKAFNDAYGFLKGDDAIKLVALILKENILGNPAWSPFLGHLGGDDFVGLVNAHDVTALCKKIISDFDKNILTLYNQDDLKRGYLLSHDRAGQTKEFPIMGLAIAVITNKLKAYSHPGEVSLVAGELKKWVKNSKNSAFAIDRRS